MLYKTLENYLLWRHFPVKQYVISIPNYFKLFRAFYCWIVFDVGSVFLKHNKTPVNEYVIHPTTNSFHCRTGSLLSKEWWPDILNMMRLGTIGVFRLAYWEFFEIMPNYVLSVDLRPKKLLTQKGKGDKIFNLWCKRTTDVYP